MKKIISLLLILCLAMGILASCAPKQEQTDTPADTPTDNTENSGGNNEGGNNENNNNNNNNNNNENNDNNGGNVGVVDTKDYLFNATFDNVQDMNSELDGTGFELEADSGSWTLVKGANGYLDNPKNDGRLYVNDNDLLLDDGSFVIQMSVKFTSMPTNKISLLTWVRKSTTATSTAYDWIVKIDNAGKLYVDSDSTPTSATLETGKEYVISVLVNGGQAQVMVDGETVGTKKMSAKELTTSRIRIFESGKANYNADIGALAIYTPDTLELLGDAEMSVFDALESNPSSTLCFAGYSSKDALTYAVGEEMSFEIFLLADGKVVSAPYFYYTVEGEDGQEMTDGFVDGSTGHFNVKGSMSKPGTLRITVYVCDENQEILTKNNSDLHQIGNGQRENLIFRGGAIAGFEDIEAAGETPQDLEEYWDEVVADCYDGDIVLQRFEELDVADYNENKVATHKLYLVEIECEGGFATGYLSLPIGATELRLKASFVSYGNKKKPTPEFSNDGAVFAICAHSFHLDDPNAQAPDGYGFDITENQDRDTVYFKNMFIRNVTATRFLKAYIGDSSYGTIVYNGETIAPLNLWQKGDSFTVNGGSQAAFQCVAITALDSDVTRAILGLTWFCDIGGESLGRFEGWNPEYTDALMYYDCCSLATLIGENVEVSISAAGLGDTTSEPTGIVALYNALNCTVTLTMYQNRSHTYNPPIADTYKKNK